MNRLLKNKADFNHKLAIKIYMSSLTLLIVNLFPELSILNGNWIWYAAIMAVSYIYCLKKVVSS